MKDRESIIQNYLDGYNSFDVGKMVQDFSEGIVFQNYQNGELTMALKGKQEFSNQAMATCEYFSERKQTILAIRHYPDRTEVDLEYFGVLAKDLSEEMKQGQEIRLNGRSLFVFENNKITKLVDKS
ncbi:nuclear transport factor 2 family protein [Litoribacter ruber]|uniref:Nuclear transport factor 2 family protein n=1 Tax=Litoribacter ruber TaxID=702568 RepID=A0AAP2CNJ3_9BACT|nr:MULTISPECIES: nuclear transport factor 2 family protein [Litoribacter]MBS9525810.1 nuclear transport factor 2 family protein [Litoribacter alkaliphilus]MBT0810467.1 nuclear transport factor 2 family protein [Litoribacter ruber]